jgi:hypothetical protein
MVIFLSSSLQLSLLAALFYGSGNCPEKEKPPKRGRTGNHIGSAVSFHPDFHCRLRIHYLISCGVSKETIQVAGLSL